MKLRPAHDIKSIDYLDAIFLNSTWLPVPEVQTQVDNIASEQPLPDLQTLLSNLTLSRR